MVLPYLRLERSGLQRLGWSWSLLLPARKLADNGLFSVPLNRRARSCPVQWCRSYDVSEIVELGMCSLAGKLLIVARAGREDKTQHCRSEEGALQGLRSSQHAHFHPTGFAYPFKLSGSLVRRC